MKRAVWFLLAMGLAQAEPPVNSYTYYNYNKKPRPARNATPASKTPSYSEVTVTAPRLEPVAPLPEMPMAPPIMPPPTPQIYTQVYQPGPAPIYDPYAYSNPYGPTYVGPYYPGYAYPGYVPYPGYSYPGARCPAPCPRTNSYNLVPQRFDPLPGEHPLSIQAPRPR